MVAYLDDHTFIQTTENTKKPLTLDIIEKRITPLLEKLQLQLNVNKCYTFEPIFDTIGKEPNQDNIISKKKSKVSTQKKKYMNLRSSSLKNKNKSKEVTSKKRKKCIKKKVESDNEGESSDEPILISSESDSEMQPINEKQHLEGKEKLSTNQTVSHDGVVLLGIPVGTDEFIENYIYDALEDKKELISRLPELPVQLAYHMLRLSITPSTNFLARALGYRNDFFTSWDNDIYAAVFTLAGQSHDYYLREGAHLNHWEPKMIERFTEDITRRANGKEITIHSEENFHLAKLVTQLASKRGGLGITITEDIAPFACLASTLNSIAVLKHKNIPFTLSEQTLEFLWDHDNRLQMAKFDPLEDKFFPGRLRDITPHECEGLQANLSDLYQQCLAGQICRTLRNNKELKRLAPLFADHLGKYANKVLTKPPTITRTFQIPNQVMREIISQTLLLVNDFGFTYCISQTGDKHNIAYCNHINACSYTGGVAEKHTHAKHLLIEICRMLGMSVHNEQAMTNMEMIPKENAYRADIYAPLTKTIIDVTCVQTSQNRKNLESAFKLAYEKKNKDYNDKKGKGCLSKVFNLDSTRLIPVVIGPRGQFYSRSWSALLNFLGIESIQAIHEEMNGLAPLLRNETDPRKARMALAWLKALSFNVAVDTAVNALKWQQHQKRQWMMTRKKNRKNNGHNAPHPNWE